MVRSALSAPDVCLCPCPLSPFLTAGDFCVRRPESARDCRRARRRDSQGSGVMRRPRPGIVQMRPEGGERGRLPGNRKNGQAVSHGSGERMHSLAPRVFPVAAGRPQAVQGDDAQRGSGEGCQARRRPLRGGPLCRLRRADRPEHLPPGARGAGRAAPAAIRTQDCPAAGPACASPPPESPWRSGGPCCRLHWAAAPDRRSVPCTAPRRAGP